MTTTTDAKPAAQRHGVFRPPTLADYFGQPRDNFLLLRFVAATMVIFGHSYALSGIPGAGDFVARLGLGSGLYTGSIAVDMFFIISGFLVTASYARRNNLEIFLKARLLRILPAYAACMILSSFVVGALFTELPPDQYLLDPATFGYVTRNLQFDTNMVWSLPGVFTHNPHPNVVNGSIWTMVAEVRMYAWVAILGFLGILQRRWLVNLVLLGLLGLGAYSPENLPLVPHPAFVQLAGFFLLGAMAYLNRDWIPVSGIVASVLLAAAFATRHSEIFMPFFALALSYCCLWFAYRPRFYFFNFFGDYSYGIYLWGFPVQQMVAHMLGGTPRPIYLFALSAPIAILLGAASWHFIEKPALSLKRGRAPVPKTNAITFPRPGLPQ